MIANRRMGVVLHTYRGHVAELVYAYDSDSYGAILGGSSPLVPTHERLD